MSVTGAGYREGRAVAAPEWAPVTRHGGARGARPGRQTALAGVAMWHQSAWARQMWRVCWSLPVRLVIGLLALAAITGCGTVIGRAHGDGATHRHHPARHPQSRAEQPQPPAWRDYPAARRRAQHPGSAGRAHHQPAAAGLRHRAAQCYGLMLVAWESPVRELGEEGGTRYAGRRGHEARGRNARS